MNDKLVRKIQDALRYKDTYSKDYLAELLNKTLVDSGEDKLEYYYRGAEDAWALARKIVDFESYGGYSDIELDAIYGDTRSSFIMTTNTAKEAMGKVEAYEKKEKRRS